MIFTEVLLSIVLLIVINFFLIKKNFLLDIPTEEANKKKIFFSKKVPKSLGFIILIFCIYKLNLNYIEFFSITLVFIIGILSDVKKLNSPKLRFLFQTLIILTYLILSQNFIEDTRIFFIDKFLKYDFFSLLLTLICILIIINGSNFIDGLNTLCIGYYLCIALTLKFLNIESIFFLQNLNSFILLLFIVYLFNLVGLSFLGDSGSYLLGFLFSITLIEYQKINPSISPWFIAILLWYPAFEILFSIIRRWGKNSNPLFPDNKHFHHILYLFFNKKLNIKNIFLNPIIANLINLFHFGIFLISYQFRGHTLILVSIFLGTCAIYVVSYYFLKKHKIPGN